MELGENLFGSQICCIRSSIEVSDSLLSIYSSEAMNILLTIHHDLDPNAGAPGVTWKLGQEFQKLGHDVDYCSLSQTR